MLLGEWLSFAEACCARLGSPRIRSAYVPEPRPDPARNAEFGLLTLDDGSAGLYYAWLGETQGGMAARFPQSTLVGEEALALARRLLFGDDASRSLAVAALNALTHSVWLQAGFRPPVAANSFALDLRAGQRLGMVGNFPSLVRQARAQGMGVTVLERKPHMVKREEGLEVTLDPAALAGCAQIVITAATLLNDSLDTVLARCDAGAEIAVVGPTAGLFPEPLFARGVAAVGGTLITDPAVAAQRLAAGDKLGASACRYQITRETYPGTRALAGL